MIGQRKGGNSMFTKSKMVPVNISQNDYLALSLYLLCITVFNMCFLFGKQNCIIPNLNSDWLIPIKVHPSFKKNRMRFYSIKVLQSFLIKVFFDRCHCQKSFKKFDQENLVKENFDSDNRPLKCKLRKKRKY